MSRAKNINETTFGKSIVNKSFRFKCPMFLKLNLFDETEIPVIYTEKSLIDINLGANLNVDEQKFLEFIKENNLKDISPDKHLGCVRYYLGESMEFTVKEVYYHSNFKFSVYTIYATLNSDTNLEPDSACISKVISSKIYKNDAITNFLKRDNFMHWWVVKNAECFSNILEVSNDGKTLNTKNKVVCFYCIDNFFLENKQIYKLHEKGDYSISAHDLPARISNYQLEKI